MTLSRPLRLLLRPASLLYGFLARARAALYAKGWRKQKRLHGAVISVGNLSVGGTGKTPLVLWLAERLLAQNQRVAILTRGYRGRQGTSDEVELLRARLQNRVRFGVGPDRYSEGHRLESSEPVDVFLLDDGFQHLQLARDIDIVLIDASRPLAGQALLPAGLLREPVSALSRAGIIIFSRTGNSQGAAEAIQRFANLPVFAASTRLLGWRRLGQDHSSPVAPQLPDGPHFAFCGIGNPEAFLDDLRNTGLPLAGQMFFADHHRYTPGDVRTLEAAAQLAGATALLTTEKDAWNLREVKFSALPVFVSIIELEITSESALLSGIHALLQARGAAA